MNENTMTGIIIRSSNIDNKLQEAFNIIKNASEHMTLWVQDADNKEKYYIINQNSILNWYKLDNTTKENSHV